MAEFMKLSFALDKEFKSYLNLLPLRQKAHKNYALWRQHL